MIAPGRADLAARARCERGTVTAITSALIDAGWLDRVHPGGQGPGDRAAYRLAAPDPEATRP